MVGELGPPSERSAVIVRATLPAGLERLRRTSVRDSIEGVPAHLTMLYPFVHPALLGPAIRRGIASVAAASRPFEYRLVGSATWPDTVYVAVEPVAPFVELQRRLGAAFPDFPIYGTDPGFEFVPHVTIAEGRVIHDPATLAHPGWRSLPRPGLAAAIEVIARPTNAPWRTIWRLPLGRMRT
ncbi:MAG: 2'-5' RNA ligase family protein [Chloroflexota bacterium]